jgi:hypothetical protein
MVGQTEWSLKMSEKWRMALQRMRDVAIRAGAATDVSTAAERLAQIGPGKRPSGAR